MCMCALQHNILSNSYKAITYKDMNLTLKPLYNEVGKCSTSFHYIEI